MSFSHPISAAYLNDLARELFADLKENEYLTLEFSGEKTQFVRWNGAKVRQAGVVTDAVLMIELLLAQTGADDKNRQTSARITLTGDPRHDRDEAFAILKKLRADLPLLPVDPYAEIPKNHGQTTGSKKGELLAPSEAIKEILPLIQGLDLAGLYTSGSQIRASLNSLGQSHWFESESFIFDYSLYTPQQKAVKGLFSGPRWDRAAFEKEIGTTRSQLGNLEKTSRTLKPGEYRVYLAPAAVLEIVPMFSWLGLGEAGIRQGVSPYRLLRTGEKSFSPLFHLSEDFRNGAVPRFNPSGEIAPECLLLVQEGRLMNTLISSRSAREYGLKSNGAAAGEHMRSPVISRGSLSEGEILKKLDTGLYLSNLHYLNWSDPQKGRITGMTRYACFWVEKGQIVAPIENLRFDESIFSIFGEALEGLTERTVGYPDTSSYGMRGLGYAEVPGALLSRMAFTL